MKLGVGRDTGKLVRCYFEGDDKTQWVKGAINPEDMASLPGDVSMMMFYSPTKGRDNGRFTIMSCMRSLCSIHRS